MPGLRHIAVQDYALLNEAPGDLRKAIEADAEMKREVIAHLLQIRLVAQGIRDGYMRGPSHQAQSIGRHASEIVDRAQEALELLGGDE